jgi:Holliday junction resolvase RusA-like endonuclease
MGRTRAALPEHIRQMVPADTRPRALTMRLVLPFPPSANHLFPTIVTKAGKVMRVKSGAAKKYEATVRQTVGLWVNHHQLQPPAPPYRLLLTVWPPSDSHKHDLTNLFKAPEDALMSAIGGDDNDVLVVAASKRDGVSNPRIELILESIV